MSKLYDIRAALKTAIISAGFGWTEDNVLIKRQGSLWNDVATAIESSKNEAVLHIGVASGKREDDDSLDYDLTLALTIICSPQPEEEATPEEDLWEALVGFVDDLRLDSDHILYRFRAGDFTDIDMEADGGTSYLGRQTLFNRRLSL